MSYPRQVERACRFAALALTDRPPTPGELAVIEQLRDDLADALLETTRLLTGLTPRDLPHPRATDTATQPVQTLLDRLAHLPRLADPWSTEVGAPSPAVRWSAGPADPGDVTGPVDAWKGLVTATVLAGAELHHAHPGLDDASRWAALGDVAILAEALTQLDGDLAAAATEPNRWTRRRAVAAAALGLESREVARLAHGPRPDPLPRGDSGVVQVSRLESLPAAVSRLAALLTAHPSRASAGDLLAVATVLAQTSRAAADAVHAAGAVGAAAADPAMRALHDRTSTALAAHSDALRTVVTTYQGRLATLDRGHPLLVAQAREIGSAAVPRLRDLRLRPARAEELSPALLGYAGVAPTATAALRASFADLDRDGPLLARDRSDHARHGWRPTAALPGVTAGLFDGLDRAERAARLAEPLPDTRPAAAPVPGTERLPAVADLRDALARRQRALRPSRPAIPVLQPTRPPAHQVAR